MTASEARSRGRVIWRGIRASILVVIYGGLVAFGVHAIVNGSAAGWLPVILGAVGLGARGVMLWVWFLVRSRPPQTADNSS